MYTCIYLQLSWFFFEIIVKSMAQTLVQSDKLKVIKKKMLIAVFMISFTRRKKMCYAVLR